MIGIDLNDPRPGFYRRRLTKNGPYVPARIWIADGERDGQGNLVTDQRILCVVNGEERDAWDEWPWLAKDPISEGTFRRMMANSEWAEGTAEPEGQPTSAIDLTRAKPIF